MGYLRRILSASSVRARALGAATRSPLVAVLACSTAIWIALSSSEPLAREPDTVGLGLLLAAGAGLLGRRRWPVVVLLGVVATTWLYLVLDYPGGAELPLVMVAVYTVVAEGHRLVGWATACVVAASGAGYRLLVDGDDPLLVAGVVAMLALVVAWGESTSARRRLRNETGERLRALEAEKELETRAELVAERLHIARELHDVLAHTITAISVQAGAAADGLAEDSSSRRELRAMRRTAQEAMQQLRATITVLRSEHEEPSGAVAPTLSDLTELAGSIDAAGVGVRVEVETRGQPRDLPAAIELTAYRIVQEALTNVVRHADARNILIVVRYAPGTLNVLVSDDGRRPPTPDAEERGFGIVGMRERAQALGGHLVTGVGDDGGFRVQAELPTAEERS